MQAFIQGQTNINNQTSQAINEIKNTLSALATSLHAKKKVNFLLNLNLILLINVMFPLQVRVNLKMWILLQLCEVKIIDQTIPSKDHKKSTLSEPKSNGKDDGKHDELEPVLKKNAYFLHLFLKD